MIKDTKSSWEQVTGGVPKGVSLGSVLFNIFVNNLDDVAECTLGKFADETKLGGVVNTQGDCAVIQRNLKQAGEMGWQEPHEVQ